jgi:hypothetical protein
MVKESRAAVALDQRRELLTLLATRRPEKCQFRFASDVQYFVIEVDVIVHTCGVPDSFGDLRKIDLPSVNCYDGAKIRNLRVRRDHLRELFLQSLLCSLVPPRRCIKQLGNKDPRARLRPLRRHILRYNDVNVFDLRDAEKIAPRERYDVLLAWRAIVDGRAGQDVNPIAEPLYSKSPEALVAERRPTFTCDLELAFEGALG